jgi:hypothetical protein
MSVRAEGAWRGSNPSALSPWKHLRHPLNETHCRYGCCREGKVIWPTPKTSSSIFETTERIPTLTELSRGPGRPLIWLHAIKKSLFLYKVVQILPGLFVCKQVTVCLGHIWTTLYILNFRQVNGKATLNTDLPFFASCFPAYFFLDGLL